MIAKIGVVRLRLDPACMPDGSGLQNLINPKFKKLSCRACYARLTHVPIITLHDSKQNTILITDGCIIKQYDMFRRIFTV